MRNLKKILCLALVLCMVLAVVSGAAYTNYADDAELTYVNEDYLLAAQLLQDIGVVVGIENLEDGKTYYAPDQLLTRAELARVLYVLYSGSVDSAVYDPDLFKDTLPTTFTDISGHWAEGYIKYGQAMGYLNGKSAEIFDPDANVKAQEMATALLIVIGYKAADIAPNYPVNVVKYGYTIDDANLFTTGLSTAPAAGLTTGHGLHIVGLGAALGSTEKDKEGELVLAAEVTREQAFYMMYKAIALRNTVEEGIAIGGDKVTVGGQYYTDSGDKYVNAKFNAGFSVAKDQTAVVAGNEKYSFVGDKYAKAGEVVLETATGTITVKDFGYTATLGGNAGGGQGYGYMITATDWNKNLGREITYTATTFKGKTYITEYAFETGVGEASAIRYYDKNAGVGKINQFKGEDKTIVKTKKVELDGAKIKIDGKSYDPYYTDGYRWIVNNSDGATLTAAQLAEKLDSQVGGGDAITLKIVGGKLYGVIEEENFFATVTDVKKVKVVLKDAAGKDLPEAEIEVAELTFMDGDKITLKNTYGFAKGECIYGFFNLKKDADTKAIAAEDAKTIAYRYDALTLEYVKVAPTAIANVAVDKANSKYYIESLNGTEFKLGAASDVATLKDGNYTALDGTKFVQNETAYWALYIVDGYCYKADNTKKEQSIDLFVTSKSVVYNTTDNKTTYTFGLNTKADGKGTAYTYTTTVTGTAAALEGIAKDETVVYYYDAQTLAATGIKEFDVLTVTETEVLNADAFGNVDTKVALVADAIAKLAEVTDENIQYRIVLPAANAGQTLPVIFGDADQEANLDNAIAAAKAVAEVILPEYDYTKTETKVVNSVDSAVAALNSGAIDVVIVDAKVTSNPFNGKYAINNSIEFVDCTFSANMNYMYIKDATFTNCTFDCGSDYAAVHYDELHGDLVFNNCTFKSGKIQIGTNSKGILSSVTFNDCVFAETEKTSIWSEMGMRVYSTAVFNNCEFNNRVVLSGVTGLSITFDSCTMNGGDAVYYVDNTDGIIRGGNVPVVTIK